jgi:DNA polymerase-3 subunit gamma/tau
LIRLCHVSDLPSPGDLVRRIMSGGAPTTVAQPGTSGTGTSGTGTSGTGTSGVGPSGAAISEAGTSGNGTFGNAGGGTRAVANGASFVAAVPLRETAPAAPVLATFRDVAALVKDQREAMLHAHLLHSTHLVRFAPPVIELRTEPDAPRDLAPKLAALLSNATGARWTIALSTAPGEPTLAQQGNAADAVRREEAADHPLIQAIMRAFPGARIDSVQDSNVDAYGLPSAPAAVPLGEPEMPDFAPPDAEFSDETPWESDA